MGGGNNNQTITSDQTCMHTVGNYYLTKQNLCLNHKNWKQSINCGSNLLGYSGTSSSSVTPGQFIEKVMQEFKKGLKEFTYKMCQLLFGLVTIVTENMQWKENSH